MSGGHPSPLYCRDGLPQEGQAVRFWLVDRRRKKVAIRCHSGEYRQRHFWTSAGGWSYPSREQGGSSQFVYAWESEPPAPPLPGKVVAS